MLLRGAPRTKDPTLLAKWTLTDAQPSSGETATLRAAEETLDRQAHSRPAGIAQSALLPAADYGAPMLNQRFGFAFFLGAPERHGPGGSRRGSRRGITSLWGATVGV